MFIYVCSLSISCDAGALIASLFGDTSLMSDMFTVATHLVKGCQTLVMDPTSLLQQSLVNTVPHTMMVH